MQATDLIPKAGKIRSYKEDGQTKWLFRIEFKELTIENDTITPSLGMEDIDLNTNDPKSLVNKKFSWDKSFFDSGAGASFYTYEHDSLNYLSVEFLKMENNKLLTNIECSIDFSGFSIEDANPNLKLKFQIWLNLETSR